MEHFTKYIDNHNKLLAEGRAIDLFVAYRFLRILTTPWEDQDAYKLGIIDKDGKLLRKANTLKTTEEKKAFTLLHRLVFNLKRILSKVGIRGALGSAAAAAIAFFREEKDYNPIIEKQIYKHIKEQGFEYDINENYGDPIQYGKYIVNRDIYDLEGDIVINRGEVIDFNEDTQPIMGYDVFKYNNVFLTTEDLNG